MQARALLACWVVGQQVSLVVGITLEDIRARLARNAKDGNSEPVLGRGNTLDAVAAQKCSFTVEAMDTRYTNVTDTDKLIEDNYWMASAMLNLQYAKKHGLEFRAVMVKDPVPNICIPWHKIWYLRNRIIDLLKDDDESKCRYILYIDSDAWFRELDMPWHEWLGNMGEKYGISTDVALIASKEEAVTDIDEAKGKSNWVNGGVLLFKVSNDAVQLLEAVIRGGLAFNKKGEAAHESPAKDQIVQDFDVFNDWPAEQGILTNLWNASNDGRQMSNWNTTADDWLSLRSESRFEMNNIAVVDMLEMNGPVGQFIEHQWGKGLFWRSKELHMAFWRAGLTTRDQLVDLQKEVMDHMVDWNGTDALLVQTPKDLQPPVTSSDSF